MKKSKVLSVVWAIVALFVINLAASFIYTRFDLTEDQRFTLSEESLKTVANFDSPVIIDILLDGNLPSEFARLKSETELLLEQFVSENNNIKIGFVDPLEDESRTDATLAELQGIGLKPASVTIEDNGKVSQELVFPWAMVNHGNNTVKVPLLKNKLGTTAEERINNSVQNLEFAFANAFARLNIKERKKVAVIKGNGELPDIEMADYLTTIREYYNIGAITLDSVPGNPQKVLDQLRQYDLALVAKPTEAFTEGEKYILDQFIMDGGKSIWLMDNVSIELDSLFNDQGTSIAIPRELNLDDFFFKHGVRINPVLIKDLYATQIVLASGEGNSSQYDPVPWYYNPMVFSKNDHPITANLEALRLQFANSIDILPNANKKTILYSSSPLSKPESTPRSISFNSLNTPPDKESLTEGNQPLAVLIEGEFTSVYMNRVKPLKLSGIREKSQANKMLVVADGDIVRNQLRNGRPLELGYDKWTNNFFGNKEFLVNSINYLLDETGLINIRSKKVGIPLLDPLKISEQKTKWQLINVGLPVVLIGIIGLLFTLLRRKKFGR